MVQITEPSLLYGQAESGQAGFNAQEVKAAADELEVELNTSALASRTFSLKEPVLASRGERDPEELFFILPETGWFKETTLAAQFSADGVPGLLSRSVEGKGLQFVTKAIDVATGVVGKVIASVVGESLRDEEPTMLAKVTRRIQKVRSIRAALLDNMAGPAHVTMETLTRILEELQKLETRLAAYFRGASREVTFQLACTVRPPKRTPEKVTWDLPLFTFEKNRGFCLSPDDEAVRTAPIPPGIRDARSL